MSGNVSLNSCDVGDKFQTMVTDRIGPTSFRHQHRCCLSYWNIVKTIQSY